MGKALSDEIRYIGLDLSITGTGYAVFDSNGDLTKSGIIKTKTGDIDIVRFHKAANQLVEEVGFQKGDRILIEDYAFSAKGQITRLAEFGATIKNKVFSVLGTYKHVRLCAPPTLKKFATGKGNVQKQIVILEVYKKWGFNTHNDNEADAFVLGKMCYSLWNQDSKMTKAEKECIKAIEKKNNQSEVYYESPKSLKEEEAALHGRACENKACKTTEKAVRANSLTALKLKKRGQS